MLALLLSDGKTQRSNQGVGAGRPTVKSAARLFGVSVVPRICAAV
jgi:hypothetical protein